MRTVILDNKEKQVQVDENGSEFHYGKEYLKTGDRLTEYSLSLTRMERGIKGEPFRTYVPLQHPESKHYIVITWPGIR
jgi:hypothetical protein